jgi:uncharacterized membrane protein
LNPGILSKIGIAFIVMAFFTVIGRPALGLLVLGAYCIWISRRFVLAIIKEYLS